MKKLSSHQIILLIVALLFISILLYKVHYNNTIHYIDPNALLIIKPTEKTNYPFPYHNDEWNHIAQAKYLIENKELPFVNPYFIDKEKHENLETGFHVFLAELFLFTKINWIENFGLLPMFLIIINSFLIFVFVRHITKNFYIALFSLLFFALLKNNVNFLGNWFFIPLTFSLIFIYAFFILLFMFLEKPDKKSLLALLGTLLVSFFIYPLSTILIFLITSLYLLLNKDSFNKIYYLFKKSNKHETKTFKKNTTIFIFLLIVASIMLSQSFIKWNQLVFNQLWTLPEITYDMMILYGVIPLIFALIGIWQTYIKYNKIFLLWLIPLLINLYLYLIYKITLFIPYPRAVFYIFIGMATLSGIGFYYICNIIYKWRNKLDFEFIKELSNETFFTLGLFVFLIMFHGYYNQTENTSLYHSSDLYDYDSINFIDNNFDNNKIVLAPPFISTTIYPISGNYVIAAMDANLNGRDSDFYLNFMKKDCNNKINLIKKNNISLILTKTKINCDEVKLIYQNKGSFVYQKT
ncbi:hypothetical protein CEE44_03145 [Candidatus Woesearchaeota archaeon B3_Woes]|nr:MAG: hypothetical protein CEE44_03145 [Candidatus Woesearchaeota archaeon B3_Woes]